MSLFFALPRGSAKKRGFAPLCVLCVLCAMASAEPKKIDVPIAIGYDAQGIRIPIRSPEGKEQVVFETEIAFRQDQQTLRLSSLRIETFDDDGLTEMVIDAPLSHFDLDTLILSSDKPITIRRPEVEITGDRLVFDTQTRQGKLTGNVRVRLLTKITEVKP